ncbi:hypothetical protein C8F01DRAFT_1087903 [Mycena amicta]|nr:hypothetical protein C8F01DRAFT_1087903 [Mycena amicta]
MSCSWIRDIGWRLSYRKSSKRPGICLGVAVIARFRMAVALVELNWLRSHPSRFTILVEIACHFGAHREGFKIASDAPRSLRQSTSQRRRADRDLQLEVLTAIRDPATSNQHPSSTEDDLFENLPEHQAQHNNLSPHSPNSPSLAWLFDDPPTPITTVALPTQNHPIPITSMSTFLMPARGANTAPKFDSSKPEELRRFFADVEYLLELAKITNVTEKKRACSRYLSVQDQELLKGLIEFSDANKTYEEFKKAALALYASNDENHLYTLKDWDAHLGSVARRGVHTEKDLADFYRDFMRMGKYLIGKKRLSETEQSHAFLRALQPASLQKDVKQRLQIIRPNVHADDPYNLTDLYDAAKFALAGSSTRTTEATADASIKQESGEISALLKAVTQLVQVMAMTQAKPATTSKGNFHFFRDCPHVPEDKQKGVCKTNNQGKLVLPDGSFPPFAEGMYLRDRFLKWHAENPGKLATTQLVVELATGSKPAPAFMLSDEQHCETLMAELNMVRTRMEACKALEANRQNNEPKLLKPVEKALEVDPATASNIEPTAAAKEHEPPVIPFPEHPFAAARDAAYAPPKDRNVGALPKPNARVPPPVSKDGDARKVFNAALDAQVVISQRDLLSVSPDIRSLYREAVTPRRNAGQNEAPQLLNTIDDPLGNLAEYAANTDPTHDANDTLQSLLHDSLPASYTNAIHQSTPTPADGYVVPDPFEVLFIQGSIPEGLVVFTSYATRPTISSLAVHSTF